MACKQEISAYEKKIENWSCSVKSKLSGNTASTPKVRFRFPLLVDCFYFITRGWTWVAIIYIENASGWLLKCIISRLELLKSIEFGHVHLLICSIIVEIRPSYWIRTSLQKSRRWTLSCRGQEVFMEAGTNMTTKPS